jgi:hypothetical protein
MIEPLEVAGERALGAGAGAGGAGEDW